MKNIKSIISSFWNKSAIDKLAFLFSVASFVYLLLMVLPPLFYCDIALEESPLDDYIELHMGEIRDTNLIISDRWGLMPIELTVFGKIYLIASNLPKGVSVTFNPFNEWPDYVSKARFAVSTDATPGSYKIALLGIGPLNLTERKIFNLKINEYKHFGIKSEKNTIRVKPGSEESINIHIYRNINYKESINIGVTGTPIGVNVKPYPEYVLPDVSISELRIQVGPSVLPDRYSLLITGLGEDGENSSCKLDLIIEPNRRFNIFVDQLAQSIIPDKQESLDITINTTDGYFGEVNLSVIKQPDIIKDITFVPSSVLLSPINPSNHSTAIISVVENALPGFCHELTIQGKGANDTTCNCSSTLCVESVERYFKLSITPLMKEMSTKENNIKANIDIKGFNGYEGEVFLSAKPENGNIKLSFDPPSIYLSPNNSFAKSAASLKIDEDIIPDTYQITINGQDSNAKHISDCNFILKIMGFNNSTMNIEEPINQTSNNTKYTKKDNGSILTQEEEIKTPVIAQPISQEGMKQISGNINCTLDDDEVYQKLKSQSGDNKVKYTFKTRAILEDPETMILKLDWEIFPEYPSTNYPKICIYIYNYDTEKWGYVKEYSFSHIPQNILINNVGQYIQNGKIQISYELWHGPGIAPNAEIWIDQQMIELETK